MTPGMSDYLIAVCKLCGHTVRISLEHGGRRAKCPRCDGIIEIPKGDTSVRLRSDLELTREARAKAGRTGPDSDPDAPAARITGRHTSVRIRRVAAKPSAPGRRIALIATLVATAAIIGGIAIVLLKKSGGEAAPAAPPASIPGPAKKTPHPPTPPPPPPPPPFAAEREEITDRLRNYVKEFNTNDLNKLAKFYACDLDTLRRAFGALPIDTEVTYENAKAKSIDVTNANELRLTLAFDRVLTNTETKKSDKQEGAERVMAWTKKEGKWVITSPPEP
jgi:hypothetical protein